MRHESHLAMPEPLEKASGSMFVARSAIEAGAGNRAPSFSASIQAVKTQIASIASVRSLMF